MTQILTLLWIENRSSEGISDGYILIGIPDVRVFTFWRFGKVSYGYKTEYSNKSVGLPDIKGT